VKPLRPGRVHKSTNNFLTSNSFWGGVHMNKNGALLMSN
jgi:hypothetical protein